MNRNLNVIKYLRWKDTCPHCKSKLYKNMDNEIYCSRCGLLVLDYFPNTRKFIDDAMILGNEQWKKRKISNKKWKKRKKRKKK